MVFLCSSRIVVCCVFSYHSVLDEVAFAIVIQIDWLKLASIRFNELDVVPILNKEKIHY